MKKFFTFLVLFTLFLVNACGGKKEVKKPSPEAMAIERAYGVAEKIKYAYLRKDRDALKLYCTKEGYLDIISSMRDFETATLNFQLRWADIKDDKIILYIYWNGSWLVKGKIYKDSGLAAFAFTGEPPLLSEILRASPFSQPE